MTRPETCGPAGGAVSLWIKFNSVTGCRADDEVITTSANGLRSGIYITCSVISSTMK